MRTLETGIQTAPPAFPNGSRHKIWIDLDNSPHVPFFVPIIEELKQRGYEILLTARDNAQVTELIRWNKLDCRLYGHHYGKNKLFKILGIGMRAIQLAPLILREKPDLALSHVSRSQIVLSSILRIPSLAMTDYEHARMRMVGIRPQWLMVPEVISKTVAQAGYEGVLTYPGIKEDVYVPRFHATPGIREEFGFNKNDLVITIRPPASDAHYHNPMSDELFRDVVGFLGNVACVRMVMLPRSKNQANSVRQQWPHLITTRKIVIPDHAVDGLNLMWFSDLVISGGGTMNREAAALGVPVYSIFRGKPAAVDRYLAANGRLTLLESPKDVKTIRLVRREPPQNPNFHRSPALSRIIENVTTTVELVCHSDAATRH